jgi:alpha-galactosidase
MDGLVNDNEGYFQVNVPNKGGALPGIPENVVVEVPATVNKSGVHPVHVKPLPPKIMYEAILPDWLEMERELLAYKTGDKTMLLWNTLQHHSTKNYDLAATMLDELMQREDVRAVEDWENMPHISEYFKYPKGM